MKKMLDWSNYEKCTALKKALLKIAFTTLFVVYSTGCIFASKEYSQTKLITSNEENSAIKEVVSSSKGLNDRLIVLQQRTISGTVTNESSEPLPGVTIVVKGTQKGTVTDINGSYFIADIPESTILEFSFIGMITKEVEVANKQTIDVVLVEDVLGLEEVVVVGYGTQKKVTLTGAASSIKAEEIQSMPNSSLSQMLEGKASGVRIQQSSSISGSSANIRIRGAAGDPLFVVDDVVVSRQDFDALTANEIESINFMKDAATASIYGARAANGVVVIQTRRGGFNQEAQFTYEGSYNQQRLPSNVDTYEVTWDDFLYLNNMKESWGDQGLTPVEKSWLKENPDFRGFGTARKWMWHMPEGHEHKISATGGGDKISYFMNLGFQDIGSGVKAANEKKYNWRSSITAQLTDKIKIEWISDGYIRNSQRPFWQYSGDDGTSDGVSGWMQHMQYFPDFVYGSVIDPVTGLGRIAQPEDYGTEGFSWASMRFTGVDGADGSYNKNNWKNFANKAKITVDLDFITKGLNFSALGSYSYNQRFRKQFTQPVLLPEPTKVDPNNRFVYNTDVSKWRVFNQSANYGIPQMNQWDYVNDNYQVNAFLNYDRSFGNHNFSTVMLFEHAFQDHRNASGWRRDIMINDVDQLFNFSGNPEDTGYNGAESEYARSSFAGRFNYNYKEKYMLAFSFRNDASSLFPRDTRWGFFPSASAAWRIDQEDWFDVSWISSLKPRFSYGSTGSEGGIAGFQFENSYSKTGGWVFGRGIEPGLRSGVLPNPDITWAKAEEYNIGLDFGVFGHIVSGGIDLFIKKNSDILGARNQSFPSTWGASLPPVNYGANEVKGFDIFLEHNNKIGEVSYHINANMSYAIDKVTIQDEAAALAGTWRSQIGKPANRIWGYRSLGILKTQADLDALPDGFTQFGRVPEIGDLLLADVRGTDYSEGSDGKVDGFDNHILSENGIPRILFGFLLGGEWKGISIDAQFSGVGSYDKMYSEAWGAGVIERNPKALKERWHPELNPDGWIPTLRQNYWDMPERGHGATSTFMFNSSYLRLKNLMLAYKLPSKLITPIGLNGIRLFVSGTDLFTISKYKFGDPEVQSGVSYPRLTTYTCGITVNF